MAQFEVRRGTRVVIAISGGAGFGWSSRLYVNDGTTATPTCAKHKTEAGARKWANKILDNHCAGS